MCCCSNMTPSFKANLVACVTIIKLFKFHNIYLVYVIISIMPLYASLRLNLHITLIFYSLLATTLYMYA